MSVLKQLGPSQPKRRPERGVLSISAPLGDFRHTLHVGRSGDAFGDTSFLSRHGGGPPPEPRVPSTEVPRCTPPPSIPQPPAPEPRTPADPLLSFHLDLGPSMLDAVLGVMDAACPGVATKPGLDSHSATQHPHPGASQPHAGLEQNEGL
ncbi:PREDICTED: cdc42 effector protein 5 [Elephantulus edwardii]|uniref:cdc42 effector protein 5 n=1 Tax=Elephantulus edwardii TaxID=28737 RepID=UPI0003F0C65C|nr:PREDICTED: cdc42 effector protein 5 [Elephantulus edwardii]